MAVCTGRPRPMPSGAKQTAQHTADGRLGRHGRIPRNWPLYQTASMVCGHEGDACSRETLWAFGRQTRQRLLFALSLVLSSPPCRVVDALAREHVAAARAVDRAVPFTIHARTYVRSPRLPGLPYSAAQCLGSIAHWVARSSPTVAILETIQDGTNPRPAAQRRREMRRGRRSGSSSCAPPYEQHVADLVHSDDSHRHCAPPFDVALRAAHPPHPPLPRPLSRGTCARLASRSAWPSAAYATPARNETRVSATARRAAPRAEFRTQIGAPLNFSTH